MFCHSCGKEISTVNNYCEYCGEKISIISTGNIEQEKNLYDSPKGKTILVFGLLGVLGIISCGLLSFFSIPAWIMGNGEIKNHPYDERVKTGRVMGIIGVILLVITVILVTILVTAVVDKIPLSRYGYR